MTLTEGAALTRDDQDQRGLVVAREAYGGAATAPTSAELGVFELLLLRDETVTPGEQV